MTPLLKHVDESQLVALQGRLEEMSKVSSDFLILLSGSTLIATFGLFQNSPAVIIGAMIIAPLMRPLVGLSLATLTADTKLLSNSMATICIGTTVGISLSMLVGMLFHSLELTPEILGRTHPTLLDLGVAIFAGAVGAYCQTKVRLADSLAGVAISVALVPPLSVVGIGLAYGNFIVWSGALLLYATNLVGIAAAGSLVFLCLGFTPLKQAKKGLLISAAISMLLIIPLGLSMKELVLENIISAKVKVLLKQKTFTFRNLQLQDVQVLRFRQPTVVVATVMAPDQPISSRQVALVQEFLNREIGRKIELKLRVIPTNEISALEVQPINASSETLPLSPVSPTIQLYTAPDTITGDTVKTDSKTADDEKPNNSEADSSGEKAVKVDEMPRETNVP